MRDEDWEVLLSFFPSNWLDLAQSAGALKGLRKDKSAPNLLRTLLLHVANGYSLRETAARARQARLADLSDVALLKRLRKSKDWLHGLCVSMFNERGLRLGEAGGLQFRLFDTTTVKEPGRTGSLWRIHYSVRVPSLACDFFQVTATKGAGTGESLGRFPLRAGDYIIADRGYSKAPGIHYAASQGAFVCVRLNPQSLVMLDGAKESFELRERLGGLAAGGVGAWPVFVPGPDESLVPGRVCAIRKSEEAIRLAHKKLRQRAVRKGQRLRPKTLFLAKYVLVFTTFPEAAFSSQDILAHYRLRWQIELVFKRFKQIAQLGHLPKHDSDSAQAWLYGKLFTALLTEKIIQCAVSVSPWGYLVVPDQAAKSMA